MCTCSTSVIREGQSPAREEQSERIKNKWIRNSAPVANVRAGATGAEFMRTLYQVSRSLTGNSNNGIGRVRRRHRWYERAV